MLAPPERFELVAIVGIYTEIKLTVEEDSTRAGYKVGVVGIVCTKTPLVFKVLYKLGPYTFTART